MPELLGRTLPDKPCQTKFHTQHGEEVKWHVSTGYRFQRSVVSGYRMHGADGGGGGVLGGGVAGSCDADTFRMHVQVESAGGKLDTKGGDWFQVKGVFVLPSDVSVSGPPGLLGGPVGADGVGVNISEKDLNLTAQFLAVSFLHASRRCTPGPHDHSFTMVREGKDPSFCAVFGAEAQVDVKRTLCGSHVTVLASVVSVGFLTMRRRRRCGHPIVAL